MEIIIGTQKWEPKPPPEVKAAIWVDKDGTLVLRLRRKTHRQNGSTLRRICACPIWKFTKQFAALDKCNVCWLINYVKQFEVGQNMYTFQAAEFAKRMKAQLQILRVPGAEVFTCKAFRAGKATALAAA